MQSLLRADPELIQCGAIQAMPLFVSCNQRNGRRSTRVNDFNYPLKGMDIIMHVSYHACIVSGHAIEACVPIIMRFS